MSATTVYVNARFLTEPVTGLQRWGREILHELDGMLADGEIDADRWRWVLLTPEQPAEPLETGSLVLHARGPLRSHLWEQLTLPRLAKGPLLNLKNTAPVRHPCMAMMIHDMQVFATPDTYSKRFVRWYRWVLPRATRRARAVMTLSRFSAGEIERYLGVAQDRIEVIRAGADHLQRVAPDPTVLERAGLRAGGYLLGVSSPNPNKNFAGVIRAMADPRLEGVPFAVVGHRDPRIFRAAGPPELLERATWLGRVSDAELLTLYGNARALIYPSFYEGLGLPPLEAMSAGCPVICSRSTALPEACGDAALYCDPADPADLAERIAELLGDDALAAELERKGRAQAASFSWRSCARRVWTQMSPLCQD